MEEKKKVDAALRGDDNAREEEEDDDDEATSVSANDDDGKAKCAKEADGNMMMKIKKWQLLNHHQQRSIKLCYSGIFTRTASSKETKKKAVVTVNEW
mmetsp:Transcript_27235/g.40195  ORF Transcript_27235/g.40195 Transcript_27235/m.40195 type:complete len:97 (-) Transcript_27235:468-758(-)